MKSYVIIAIFISILATTKAFADDIPYCIRIYCEKDINTKIRNDDQRTRIFQAIYDEEASIYLIGNSDWQAVKKNCGSKTFYYGTNAARYQRLTTWTPVHGEDSVSSLFRSRVKANEECAKLQAQQ